MEEWQSTYIILTHPRWTHCPLQLQLCSFINTVFHNCTV